MVLSHRKKLISIVLAVLAIVAASFVKKLGWVSAFQEPAPKYSLAWLAQRAQARGVNEVFLDGLIVDGVGPDNFDTTRTRYSVIVAHPEEVRGYDLDPSGQLIGSWYKFKVDEVLSQAPISDCGTCGALQSAPSDFTFGPNEVGIPRLGGTVVVNGVKIHSEQAGFPDFGISQQYLLFLEYEPANHRAVIPTGAEGVFTVTGDVLTPVSRDANSLRADILNRFNNSLSQVRSALSVTPPPPRAPAHEGDFSKTSAN